jgi:hypothetical protein
MSSQDTPGWDPNAALEALDKADSAPRGLQRFSPTAAERNARVCDIKKDITNTIYVKVWTGEEFEIPDARDASVRTRELDGTDESRS